MVHAETGSALPNGRFLKSHVAQISGWRELGPVSPLSNNEPAASKLLG
jgi:hypothetical protein